MSWKSAFRSLSALPQMAADRLLGLPPRGWLIVALLAGALLVAIHTLRRRREQARARDALAEAVRMELDVPPSLHPVIDPDVCIGSGSCISACPEGKILGIVDGVAKLVSASHCIGHGRCAAECPVDAIKLVFGAAERGVDLPELDGHFETARPGVYIVGELAGMGLIKNALIQGLQVAARIGEALDPQRAKKNGVADVAIVGAGPAGIAAAVGARAAGLSFAVIEQDTVGGTIAHYPRQKLVMSETVPLPYYGPFGRRLMSKEELMAALGEVMTRARVRVHAGAKVVGIDGQRDDFVVRTTRGDLRARRVVLAIGRRGSPRRMDVPGEDLPKVAYRLIDPTQYQGRRVLVVGGGDSALEAAIMLAEETDAEVGVVYRKPEFARCRPLNKQKIDALIARRRVRAFLATDVAAVEPDAVRLKGRDGAVQPVPNDFVIACLGGELPTDFLRAVGVDIHRHVGDRAMPNPALTVLAARGRRERFRPATLAAIGVVVLSVLALAGQAYYRLPRALRYQHVHHALLKPSGLWGHGVGILATGFMLSNFVYPLRKRLPRFKGRGPIAPWLRFHVFVGLMSPLTILFHSAFQWSNHLATCTYVSLVIVVVTGLVGRYLYGLVRLDPGHDAHAAALRRSLQQTLADRPVDVAAWAPRCGAAFRRLLALIEAHAPAPAGAAVVGATAGGAAASRLLPLLLGRPGEAWSIRRGLAEARPLFADRGAFRHFRAGTLRLRRSDLRAAFHQRFKRLMNVWRVFHVTLSVLLLGLIGLHVWISLHLGFKWIWS
jgi:thioredoxin reductase/Pyruvate/2-oxoacid:ferredoxin oxidoreductase delta subunit